MVLAPRPQLLHEGHRQGHARNLRLDARQGVPFHKHKKEDESFFVVEGIFEISVGYTTIIGGPGTYAFGPREIPHRWTSVGTTPGRTSHLLPPSAQDLSS